MVAPIVSIEDPASKPQGAHLTFLKPDGTGKADLSPPRLCLGAKKGGCIKLTPDEDVTTGLAIAEGVETALAGIRVGFPAWSCIDAGNLAAFPVLPGIEALTVIADHDQAGLDAADQVALRWHQAGREARILTPGQPGSDLNDMLMGGGNG
jgi:hypothetical protein